MKTLFVGQNKITLQTVDSTNNYAAKLLKMSFVPDGTVIMAQNQTDGRGQRENVWKSEPGQNLLCSFILQPKALSVHSSFMISMVSALAVCDTLKSIVSSSNIAIKWPNDILLDNKKISGILIENSIVKGAVKSVIIGIGINSNQTEFDYPQATSICNETNRLTDTDILLGELSIHLEKWYLLLISNQNSKIISHYNSLLWKREQEIQVIYRSEEISGRIKKVNTEGKLIFLSNKNRIEADFSELKIPYEK